LIQADEVASKSPYTQQCEAAVRRCHARLERHDLQRVEVFNSSSAVRVGLFEIEKTLFPQSAVEALSRTYISLPIFETLISFLEIDVDSDVNFGIFWGLLFVSIEVLLSTNEGIW
jgi:hypothetical protein